MSVQAILGTLLLSSIGVWGWLGWRWSKSCQLCDGVEHRTVLVPWIPMLLTGVWIVLQCASASMTPVREEVTAKLLSVKLGALLNALLTLGVLVPLVTDPKCVPEQFGFHLKDWSRQVRIGLFGFLAMVLPVMAVHAASMTWRGSNSKHGLLRLLAEQPTAEVAFWVCFAAGVLAPLAEELLYRVVFITSLESRMSARASLLISSVAFAAVHRLPDSLPLFPLALVLGYVYQKQRSFLAVVLIHALFNAVNLWCAWLMIPEIRPE